MKFSIIYHDLSVVRGETLQDWLNAPNEGVQFVDIKHGTTVRGISDFDYYYFLFDSTNRPYIWGCNDVKPQLSYLKEPATLSKEDKERFNLLGFKEGKKTGLTVSDEQFEECRKVHAKEVEWLRSQ